ncbi:hypothetical protein [Crocosphaera chwakensis]|nr:hypothetical protein [Crocosphaera chwakensis]
MHLQKRRSLFIAYSLNIQKSYDCWVSSLNPTYKIGDRTTLVRHLSVG